jgi:signal transduction histidine kinase
MTSAIRLGAIYAAAEMLMDLDPGPNQVKRLATNIYRAAGRMRELLADLNSVARGNRSTAEMCERAISQLRQPTQHRQLPKVTALKSCSKYLRE